MENYEKKDREVLERLKELLNDAKKQGHIIVRVEDIEKSFPELTETEDEKIRKTLIAFFNDLHKTKSHCWGLPIPTILDWLGKQSEVVRLDEQIWQIANNSAKTWEQSFAILQATQTAYNKGKKDALKEHKPADKVEPKFHEGDWVVYVCGEESTTLQISRIIEGTYEFTDSSSLNVVDEDTLHLWTIQDAKDGDVLCCENGWTCIFKTLVNDETFSSYCFTDNTKWFCETGSECHTLKEEFVKAYNGKIYPATKEQRDLLFQKMKEAGYEWDAEKKELKKQKEN